MDQAGSTANKITSMSVKPATKVRAKDIVRGAQALAEIFRELDDRDELSRNSTPTPAWSRSTPRGR